METWQFSRKQGMSVLAVLVSIASLGISFQALKVSEGTREDSRKISGLDLQPDIYFYAQLNSFNENGIPTPPNFSITNVGPVPATQVRVQFLISEYDTEEQKITFTFSGYPGQEYVIDKIDPLQSKTFLINSEFLEIIKGISKGNRNQAIEVNVYYRRDADKSLFQSKAFYFMGKNGVWIDEETAIKISPDFLSVKSILLKHKDSPGNFKNDLNSVAQDPKKSWFNPIRWFE